MTSNNNNEWNDLPNLEEEDSRPLYIQCAEVLKHHILSRSIALGVLLPSEPELMQRYGLSRTTVRQAIQRLEDSGFVKKAQGKGTFVTANQRRNRLNAFRSMEPGLAELGLEVTNVMIEQSDAACPEWAVNLGFPNQDRVRIFKRLKIVEEQPLALEIRVVPIEVSEALTEEDLIKRPFYDVLSTNIKTKIQHVTYSITSGVASEKLAKMLGVEPGAPIVIRMGLYFTLSGQPVMASKIFFIAERIELRFEFDIRDENWGIVIV